MIHLSRSTAVFAVRLLLSVAVVYRFFHAENKSIFAQRYCPCTPPDGTKHTNVRRAGTKYKTIVKDMHYPLIPCGFLPLAPLAEMRYTGNAKTNVKERNSLSQTLRVCQLPRGGSLWRVPLPSCRFASIHLPQGGGFGSGGKRARPLRRLRASSPKGRASGETGYFTVQPETLPPCQGLPLWGSWQSR